MEKGIIVHTLIENEEGKILIIHRSKNNDVLPEYWDIPGGTLEGGEDPAAGAIREVLEETGINISSPKIFFQESHVDIDKNKQFITLVFQAKVNVTNIKLNPEEHDDFAWISVSEVGDYKTVDYLSDCIKSYCELKGVV